MGVTERIEDGRSFFKVMYIDDANVEYLVGSRSFLSFYLCREGVVSR